MSLVAQKEKAGRQSGFVVAQVVAGTDHGGLALTPHEKIKPLGKPFRVPTKQGA